VKSSRYPSSLVLTFCPMKGSPGTPTQQRFSLLNRRESTVKTFTKEQTTGGPSLLETARLAAANAAEEPAPSPQVVIPVSPLAGSTRSMLMRRDSSDIKTIVKPTAAENVQSFLQQFAPTAQAQNTQTPITPTTAPIANSSPISNDLVEIKETPAATNPFSAEPAPATNADPFDQVWQLAGASDKHGDDAFWEQLTIASDLPPAAGEEVTTKKILSIDVPASAEAAQEALDAILNPSLSDTEEDSGRGSTSRAYSPSPRGSSSDRSPPSRARRPSRVVSTPSSTNATPSAPLSPTARSAPVSPAPRSPNSSSLTTSRARAYSIPNRPTTTTTPVPRTTRAASITSPVPRSPSASASPAVPKSPSATPLREPEVEDLSEEASDTISAVVTRTRALSPAPHTRPPPSPRSPFIADAVKPRPGYTDRANQADEFDGMAPSYGQLQSENISLLEENARLKAEVARLIVHTHTYTPYTYHTPQTHTCCVRYKSYIYLDIYFL